jgi:hypothetical protein
MYKEKATRDVMIRVQPSLFKAFQEKCNNNYKTISEVIRDFMVKFVKESNVDK